jgi:hypothetical protein
MKKVREATVTRLFGHGDTAYQYDAKEIISCNTTELSIAPYT